MQLANSISHFLDIITNDSRPDTHFSSRSVKAHSLDEHAPSSIRSDPTFTADAREDERMIPTGLQLATGQN
ncbi:hypothetical protein PanWU01x14_296000 [Parasponia andersonii]|uniref:Uncharacterized protein n=1 Tax=Parasponia andersonii TaxID=3476 RepID=A0A2P5AVP8_PARAD|nr:hypothetical protein PanWU01x14_296000 [Parasponia andersonii]